MHYVSGLCILCTSSEDKQANSCSVYGQPWIVHEEKKARHNRSSADEGSGSRGQAGQTDGATEARAGTKRSRVCRETATGATREITSVRGGKCKESQRYKTLQYPPFKCPSEIKKKISMDAIT